MGGDVGGWHGVGDAGFLGVVGREEEGEARKEEEGTGGWAGKGRKKKEEGGNIRKRKK